MFPNVPKNTLQVKAYASCVLIYKLFGFIGFELGDVINRGKLRVCLILVFKKCFLFLKIMRICLVHGFFFLKIKK